MESAGVKVLVNRIEGAVNYCAAEFDISTAEVVGVLDIVKHAIVRDSLDEE